MKEIWRDIEGYEGYQVSNFGNVKSLGNCTHPNEHLLSLNYNHYGYKSVKLSSNGVVKSYLVHCLVAKAFPEICGEWFEGCEVDHIDTIRDNNVPENLKVCTCKENVNNPLTRKHMSESKMGSKNPNYGVYNEKALKALSDKISKPLSAYKYPTKEFVGTWRNSLEASEELNIPQQNINACCNGNTNRCTAKGLMFVFNTVSDIDGVLNDIIEKRKNLVSHRFDKLKTSVMQFTMDWEYIATYDSANDAARALGVSGGSHISACCKGKRDFIYNYRWKYAS